MPNGRCSYSIWRRSASFTHALKLQARPSATAAWPASRSSTSTEIETDFRCLRMSPSISHSLGHLDHFRWFQEPTTPNRRRYISRSRAMRSSIGGWVEKRRLTQEILPSSGVCAAGSSIHRCEVA